MGTSWDRSGDVGLCLLGKPRLRLPSGRTSVWGSGKEAQLLALLALEREREAVPGYEIQQELWEEGKKTDLGPVVSNLKTRLQEDELDGLVAQSGAGWRFADPEASVDCLEVAELVEAAEHRLAAQKPELAWPELVEAIKLLAEECFAGARGNSPFVDRLRDRMGQLRARARVLACEAATLVEDREWRQVAEREAKAAISEVPFREPPYAALAKLMLASGRHGDALELIRKFEGESLEGVSEALLELRSAAMLGRASSSRRPRPLILSVPRADEEAGFVGRDRHLEQLDEAARVALANDFAGRELVGDKGVGKSRIAREFGARAHAKGFAVLTAAAARGPSAIDTPCKPLVDAILAWADGVDTDSLLALDWALVELSRFAPELGERLGLERPPEGPGRDIRLRRGLVEAVRRIAKVHPTLLLIDDLGELDPGTRACLAAICSKPPERLMVLATSDGSYHELPLLRVPVDRPELREAVALARKVLGNEAEEGEVVELAEMADLLPYLIVNRSDSDRIYEDLVRPRIEPLGAGGLEVIRLAALLGPQLDVELLRRVTGDDELVRQTLAHAERTKLIGTAQPAGRLEFRHSLTRAAIVAGIPAVEREELAERLTPALGGEEELSAARLQMLEEGGGTGAAGETCVAALDAGNHASELANYPAALDHYRKGLELAAEAEVDVHGRLLIGAGQAHWSLGEYKEARQDFETALGLEGLDPALRAVAAIGFGGKLAFGGARTDSQYIATLGDALSALGREHPQLRVRVQAALAGALTFGALTEVEIGEREELVAAALAGIEGEGPELRAEVLSDICWSAWDPQDAGARRRLAGEFVAVADESHDIGLAIEARIFRIASSLADGDVGAYRRDMASAARLSRRAGLAQFDALLLLLEAMDALLAGDMEAARDYSGQALEIGGREQNPAVFQLYGAQTLMVHLFDGRVDQIRAAAVALTDAFPHMPAWKAGVGLIFAQLGRYEDARRQLDLVAVDGFGSVPRDLFWLATLDHAAKLAAALEDRERCQQLYALLEPHAGEIVVAGGAVAVYGAVDRVLGLMAGVLGRTDAAVGHLRDAVAINEALGARAINAYAMTDLAAQLRRAGEEAEAQSVARQAQALADQAGLLLQMRQEATRFSTPQPAGVLGPIKQRGAVTMSQLIRRLIDGKTDKAINQLAATRILRRLLPAAFVPSATCGWEGTIQLEFEPPIGYLKEEGCWRLVIGATKVKVHTKPVEMPALRLRMSPATFFKLMAGTLNPVAAWLDGDVEVGGDPGDPTVAARIVEMFCGPTPVIDL